MPKSPTRSLFLVVFAALGLVGLGLAGCATPPGPAGPGAAGRDAAVGEPAPYDPVSHGTAWEEWGPHAGVHEWWYLTAVVGRREPGGPERGLPGPGRPGQDGAADAVLLQFTIFHFDIEPRGVYMLHLACSDYGSGEHLFEQFVSFDPREAGGEGSRVRFRGSDIELSPAAMRVRGEGRDLSMDLIAWIAEPPVWHGEDGIVSMGHPEDPGENSFYYSFVRMETTGTVGFRKTGGEWVSVPVSGSSWFDRQWGRFEERGWDWFSLRFFDGDRVMLFVFPGSGHREATFAPAGGSVSWPEGFDYKVERWVERGGSRYGLSWQLELPVKDGRYRVVPLHLEDFNPNLANDYWEGLCRLLDDAGRAVGWCVAETTAPAHTP